MIRTANAQSDKLALEDTLRTAKQGDLRSLMRIGQMFETGTLLPKDPAKACQFYKIAADEYGKVDRYSPGAPLVAAAFLRAARCFAEGPEVQGVWRRSPDDAVAHYLHAGVTLRDPIAAFELARFYLTSDTIQQNPTVAIDMLELAARKHFAPAQALLGSLLWEGKVMKQEKPRGLALMIIGRERAGMEYRPLVTLLYDDAMLAASKQDEADAKVLVEKYKAANNGDPSKDGVGTSSMSDMAVPRPQRSPTREVQDFIGEIDSYSTMPTGAVVPPSEAEPKRK